jgi:hypothetical protein
MMAFGDYHACDHCGAQKTFYDANLDGEYVDGEWRYNANPPHYPGYRAYALCNECEKTHQIVIVRRPAS